MLFRGSSAVPACRQAGSGQVCYNMITMEYFVYALKSLKTKRIYVGMTSNIKRRLSEHNKGEVFSTRSFRPWIVIFSENCGDSRVFTRKREKYWKSGVGKEILKHSVVAQR